MPSTINRFGIVLLLILISYIYIQFTNKKNYRNKKLGLEGQTFGIPAILYFTTPDCQICKNIQEPELNKIKEKLKKDIQIIKINAMEEVELADYWGVLSVPTTFIIDSFGRPRQLNFGVAPSEKLIKQLDKSSRSINGEL